MLTILELLPELKWIRHAPTFHNPTFWHNMVFLPVKKQSKFNAYFKAFNSLYRFFFLVSLFLVFLLFFMAFDCLSYCLQLRNHEHFTPYKLMRTLKFHLSPLHCSFQLPICGLLAGRMCKNDWQAESTSKADWLNKNLEAVTASFILLFTETNTVTEMHGISQDLPK